MIPRCSSCLAKHLSECAVLAESIRQFLASGRSLSFEVMDGHSAGGNPDHRVDLSGELIQAEKHAVVLDRPLALKIRYLRRTLQSQRWRPTEADVEKLRTFWYFTFSLDMAEMERIRLEDRALAAEVDRAVEKFANFQSAPEESNVESCGCGAAREKVQRFRNEAFSQPTSIVYCSDSAVDPAIRSHVRDLVVGADSMIVLPKSFERWPEKFLEENGKVFDEVSGNLLCLWPEGVDVLRRTNALAFPSVVDEGGAVSDGDARFLSSKGVEARSFFRVPVCFTPPLLSALCSQYRSVNGAEEIGDLYSVLRSMDLSPKFGNENRIVVRDRRDATEKTLFVVP